MSVQLQNQLAHLMLFAGIPSYDRRIAAINMELNGYVNINQFNARNNAQDNQIDSLDETVRLPYTTNERYFIDALNGNDSNNGKTEGSAFKTLQGVFAGVRDICGPNRIEFLSDIEHSGTIDAARNYINMLFSGNGHKLTLSGNGIGIIGGGGASFYFFDLETVFNKSSGDGFNISGGHCEAFYNSSDVSAGPLLGQSNFLWAASTQNFIKASSIFDANVADRINVFANSGPIPTRRLTANTLSF